MRSAWFFLLSMCLAFAANAGHAHALDPGYLDIRQLTAESWQVLWRTPDVNGRAMEIEAVLPEHCSPARGPDPTSDGAAWLSVWVAECDSGLAGHPITVKGLEAQRNDVLLRLQPLDGEPTTLRFTPQTPVLTVPIAPTIWSVFASYFRLGFEHILEGWDHLLFVFALFVLVRDPWRLVGAITAFTVAHSITLALATLGVLRVPGQPVEAVIALSIVFLALEILKQRDGQMRLSEQFPWIVCFCFGLLHGLGFAGALSEIGLPPTEIPAALIAFNIGVEAGQLTFIAALFALFLLGRSSRHLTTPTVKSIAKSATGYSIGCLATYWLVERVSGFAL
ncbi:HupE/UreJ family protein [Ruegeria sp. 2012CJ15-1]